ncbi:hypothetical protein [uncultured Dokdonia sp.]|uniref:hypothetical protein n=1 Tax=uncultured Dokdonia sp. TaxID=575653 RepID=UPI0026354975|nr:hypothetical protein [uncultured Dokdonia sp.]
MADFFNKGVEDEEEAWFSKPIEEPMSKKTSKVQDMSKRELLEESIENQRLQNKYLKTIKFCMVIIGFIMVIYFLIDVLIFIRSFR